MSFYDLSKKVFKRPENVGTQEFQGLNIDITDTITLCGQKGSGKSYLASVLADSYPNVVFWDSRWERYTKKDKSTASTKALMMPEKWITADSPNVLREHLLRGKTHIIYHPAPLIIGKRAQKDMINEFNQVAEIIFQYSGITFFIDEADQIMDSYHMPEGMFNILQYGKHRNVGSICITRRLQHLHTSIPRLSALLIFFRLSAKDWKYISEFLIEPDEEQKGKNQEEYEHEVIDKNTWMNNMRKEITHLPDRFFYTFDGKDMIKFKPIPEVIKS